MFTGIIEEIGQVANIIRHTGSTTLGIKSKLAVCDVKIGDSIAVNGVCLTAIKQEPGTISFEVIPETLAHTSLGSLRIRDKVNLERALKVGDRVSGHFVTGHIDCLGVIRRKIHGAGNFGFEINIPAAFSRYVVPKGSVSVDGISLTIAEKGASSFTVYLIPHTLKHTILQFKGPSEKVNIEFDILAKRASL